MRITQIVKALPFLPASWISSKIYQNKTQEESQIRLEKWSTLILKVLGYRLQVQGVENVPMQETIYFVSNHQGTLDQL